MKNTIKTRRPFLTAEWRYLVMLNYEVDPQILAPLVPRGTTLDLWNGRAFVSVVGFRFLRTRVLGVPVLFHRDFTEVNLRFYVRRELPGGEVRRGVTFVRELVPRTLVAVAARLTYNEPYLTVPMRSHAPQDIVENPGTVKYEWNTGGQWQHVAAHAVGAPWSAQPGSEAEFITEHYWGYTGQRDGSAVEYQVTHPQWRLWDVEKPELVADVRGLYGSVFDSFLQKPLSSAWLVEGSPIAVYSPSRMR